MNHNQHPISMLDTQSASSAHGLYTLSIDYVGGGYPGEKFQRVIEVP